MNYFQWPRFFMTTFYVVIFAIGYTFCRYCFSEDVGDFFVGFAFSSLCWEYVGMKMKEHKHE